MDVGAQLHALADPTRRAIFDLVRERPSSVRELTDQVPISQPAVSQHLGVLLDAHLVGATKSGTRRIYRPNPEGVGMVRAWADTLWDDALDAFVDAAENEGDRTDQSTHHHHHHGARR
jgi:DNA-binding transcriptional ArsR family regulator